MLIMLDNLMISTDDDNRTSLWTPPLSPISSSSLPQSAASSQDPSQMPGLSLKGLRAKQQNFDTSMGMRCQLMH